MRVLQSLKYWGQKYVLLSVLSPDIFLGILSQTFSVNLFSYDGRPSFIPIKNQQVKLHFYVFCCLCLLDAVWSDKSCWTEIKQEFWRSMLSVIYILYKFEVTVYKSTITEYVSLVLSGHLSQWHGVSTCSWRDRLHVLRLPVNVLNLWLWGFVGKITPPHATSGYNKGSWDLWGFLKLVINFRVSNTGSSFWTGWTNIRFSSWTAGLI
jgi:hypothetical protein